MSSPFRRLIAFALALAAVSTVAFAQKPLRVCADPDNLPFSTRQQTGFDNKIASLIGAELKRPVEFTWARMGRGFVREFMNTGRCDLLLGVPSGMRGLLETHPYYRSSYVFVLRRGEHINSLDDPALKRMKIGVHVLDDDYAPPAQALTRRGLARNIVGFDMDKPGEIVRAVADGKIDAAIAWGPAIGYYAQRFGSRVRLVPVTPEFDPPGLPLRFDIAVGVRKSDHDLFQQVDAAVVKVSPQIRHLLTTYHVPTLGVQQTAALGGAK